MQRFLVFTFVCFGFLLSASAAFAQNAFDFKLENKRQTDQGKPAIVLRATESIKKGTVEFLRSDGKSQKTKIGRMKPSAEKRIVFKQKKNSRYSYQVIVKATTTAGQELTNDFETTVSYVDPIKLRVDPDRVDTGEGKLILQSNQPIEKVDIEVFDTDGNKIVETTEAMGSLSGDLNVTWKASRKSVGGIRLRAWDTSGFWAAVLLEPFWVEIPHKEVIFDFGKATWQDTETPKLTETLNAVKQAMGKHRKKGLTMQLYIAGYTDTVGSASQNQALSKSRARSIAKWFRSNGLKLQVYYQGFGESVLRVKTKDNVPEARNRRALYILGNAKPPTSGEVPRSNWSKL